MSPRLPRRAPLKSHSSLVAAFVEHADGARRPTKSCVGGRSQLLSLFLLVAPIVVQIALADKANEAAHDADSDLRLQAGELGDADDNAGSSLNRDPDQGAIRRVQRRLFMVDFDESVDYDTTTTKTTTTTTTRRNSSVVGSGHKEIDREEGTEAARAKASSHQNQSGVEHQQHQRQDVPRASSSISTSGANYESGPNDTSQLSQSSSTSQNSTAEVLELSALQAARLGYFRHSMPISVILAIAYTMVFIVGIVGNSFVVAIVCKSPRMRTVTNYFIANLALADILVLLFCLPATLVGNLFIPWVLGQFVCKAMSYLQGVAVSASINTMVTVTMDRFLAICFPLDWHMSRRMARWVIGCIWLFSLSISLPWALYFTLVPYPLDNQTIQVCAEEWPNEQLDRIYFICANLILLYLFPATVIILCYLGIWYKIERRNIPGDQPAGLKIELIMQKSKLKVVKMMMVVVVLFLLSWLPTYLICARIKLASAERGANEEWLLAKAMPLAQWLGASNSCINPILYTFFNRKYKRGFLDLLRFTFCCKPLMKTPSLSAEGQGYTIANKSRGGNGQMRENGHSMVPLNFNNSGGGGGGGGNGGGRGLSGGGRQSNISTTSIAISSCSGQDNGAPVSKETTPRSSAGADQVNVSHVHCGHNGNVKYGHGHSHRLHHRRHHKHQHGHRHQQLQQQLQQQQQLLLLQQQQQHNYFNDNKAISSSNKKRHSNLWTKDNILVERDNNSLESAEATLVLHGHCSSSSKQQSMGETPPRANQQGQLEAPTSKGRVRARQRRQQQPDGTSDKRARNCKSECDLAPSSSIGQQHAPRRPRHRHRHCHHHTSCPKRRDAHRIRSQSGSGQVEGQLQPLAGSARPDKSDSLQPAKLGRACGTDERVFLSSLALVGGGGDDSSPDAAAVAHSGECRCSSTSPLRPELIDRRQLGSSVGSLPALVRDKQCREQRFGQPLQMNVAGHQARADRFKCPAMKHRHLARGSRLNAIANVYLRFEAASSREQAASGSHKEDLNSLPLGPSRQCRSAALTIRSATSSPTPGHRLEMAYRERQRACRAQLGCDTIEYIQSRAPAGDAPAGSWRWSRSEPKSPTGGAQSRTGHKELATGNQEASFNKTGSSPIDRDDGLEAGAAATATAVDDSGRKQNVRGKASRDSSQARSGINKRIKARKEGRKANRRGGDDSPERSTGAGDSENQRARSDEAKREFGAKTESNECDDGDGRSIGMTNRESSQSNKLVNDDDQDIINACTVVGGRNSDGDMQGKQQQGEQKQRAYQDGGRSNGRSFKSNTSTNTRDTTDSTETTGLSLTNGTVSLLHMDSISLSSAIQFAALNNGSESMGQLQGSTNDCLHHGDDNQHRSTCADLRDLEDGRNKLSSGDNSMASTSLDQSDVSNETGQGGEGSSSSGCDDEEDEQEEEEEEGEKEEIDQDEDDGQHMDSFEAGHGDERRRRRNRCRTLGETGESVYEDDIGEGASKLIELSTQYEEMVKREEEEDLLFGSADTSPARQRHRMQPTNKQLMQRYRPGWHGP